MVKRLLFIGIVLIFTSNLVYSQKLLPANASITFRNTKKVDGVNSEAEESYPLLYTNGDLYFVRSFHSQNTGGKLAGQDIWLAEFAPGNAKFSETSNDFSKLNNKNNNAVVGFTSDGQNAFLLNSGKRKSVSPGISVVVKTDKGWSKPEKLDFAELNFAGNYYSINISQNGSVAFISMEKTKGNADIFITYKDKSGNWTTPKLIDAINTTKAETTPFYYEEWSLLIFSRGKGKSADIMYSRKLDNSWDKWSKPAYFDINSSQYDAYFTVNSGGHCFFSSSRTSDFADIYYTKMQITIPKEDTQKAIVLADTSKETLAKADSTIAAVKNEPKPDKVEKDTEPKIDLSTKLVYFKFNVATPKKEDIDKIKQVAEILINNPKLSIELRGHTDNIGSHSINVKFSRWRAQSVKKILLKEGVKAQKITIKFYAYDKPAASNKTANGRALNRRVELDIKLPKVAL